MNAHNTIYVPSHIWLGCIWHPPFQPNNTFSWFAVGIVMPGGPAKPPHWESSAIRPTPHVGRLPIAKQNYLFGYSCCSSKLHISNLCKWKINGTLDSDELFHLLSFQHKQMPPPPPLPPPPPSSHPAASCRPFKTDSSLRISMRSINCSACSWLPWHKSSALNASVHAQVCLQYVLLDGF